MRAGTDRRPLGWCTVATCTVLLVPCSIARIDPLSIIDMRDTSSPAHVPRHESLACTLNPSWRPLLPGHLRHVCSSQTATLQAIHPHALGTGAVLGMNARALTEEYDKTLPACTQGMCIRSLLMVCNVKPRITNSQSSQRAQVHTRVTTRTRCVCSTKANHIICMPARWHTHSPAHTRL
jgi:hypothetical protein